jgi:hypothetical protein
MWGIFPVEVGSYTSRIIPYSPHMPGMIALVSVVNQIFCGYPGSFC